MSSWLRPLLQRLLNSIVVSTILNGAVVAALVVLAVTLVFLFGRLSDLNASAETLTKQVQNLTTAVQRPANDNLTVSAQEAFRDVDLTRDQLSTLLELASARLGARMARDADARKSIQDLADAVKAGTLRPDSTGAASGLKILHDAIREAASLAGMPDAQALKVADKLQSLLAEAGKSIGKTVFDEMVKDAYRFVKDWVFGGSDRGPACGCCAGSCPVLSQPPGPEPPRGGELSPSVVVRFPLGKSAIRDESQVEQVWRAVRLSQGRGSTQKLHLTAFTDTTGSDGRNQQLRNERAKAVTQALVDAGVPSQAIVVDSLGGVPLPVGVVGSVRIPSNRAVVIDLR